MSKRETIYMRLVRMRNFRFKESAKKKNNNLRCLKIEIRLKNKYQSNKMGI